MSLQTRLTDLVAAIGADIKNLRTLDRPAYMPSTAQHKWHAERSTYNDAGPSKHKIRRKLSTVSQNTAGVRVGYFANSTGVGYNGATFDKTKSIPFRLAKALARLTGNPYYTTGIGFAAGASGGSAYVGDIWTLTGSWTTGSGCLISLGAGTATLVTTEMCTDIAFFVADNGPAGGSYTVDGGSSTTITVGGTTALKYIHISGLTYGYHTVVVTVPTTLYSIAGQGWWTPALNQIHMHRLCFGGATANSGTTGVNWSVNTVVSGTAGLGWVAQQMISLAGLSFDIAIVQIGSNDIYASAANASAVQPGIENILGYASGAIPILVHEIPTPGTDATAAATVGTAFFNEADTKNCMMFDWNDYVNNPDGSYTGDSNQGADGVHPTFEHQNEIATWIAERICEHVFAGEAFANAGVIGNVGGRFKIVEQSGTWPLRPPVVGGYVDWEGPDAVSPDAMCLDGDSWDDT